jgi:hypothetical protein
MNDQDINCPSFQDLEETDRDIHGLMVLKIAKMTGGGGGFMGHSS